MKLNRLYLVAGLLLVIIATGAFVPSSPTPLQFVVPKGWEQPTYDFAKNPITEEGFRLGRKLFFDPGLVKR
jgi:cytochrome c peroxidase